MIMDIKYIIEFFSNWHCGSGLAAGADVDALVVKDADGLPYVPGKTVKGLLREAAEELNGTSSLLNKIFGLSGEAVLSESNTTRVGESFFSNATLPEGSAVIASKLTPHLYQTFASTSIDEKSGIAKDNTLRRIETVVPCSLEGEIRNIPEGGTTMIEEAMLFIKRMGTGRNRGYGRCKISVIK
jgi:CRISPR/Cas system CSM-associated protein Csm3 (group 7 of RAMP superfamily)